jgi:hypothetical protein
MAQDFGTLGRLVVSLEANIAQFQSDLGRAEYQMQQFGQRIDAISGGATSALKGIGLAMAGIGAGLSISAIEDKFHSITSGLAGLKEMSEKTGASVENLSAMAAVARIAGVEMGSVEMGAIKMAKALAGADDTAKGAGHALEYLGLSAKQMRGMDTAEAMQLVATRMEDVKDGASKVAIAMDIFGKSGAQLIPYLHDMVTTGDLVVKATDEQAEAAKRYEMDVKRLTLTKDQLYKTVTIAVLPAMDSLIKVLINANNETNGLRAAAKDLAADGSINSWAESAATGVGHIMDEFILLKYLVEQAIIPFERLGKNIENLGVSFGILTSGGSIDEMKAAFATATAESQNFYASLDARKHAPMPSPHYADDIKTQFVKDKAEKSSRFDADLDDVMYGDDDKRNSYTSRAPTDGKNAKVDPYQAFVDRTTVRATGLSDGEIAKLQKESDLAAGRSREQGFSPDTAAGAGAIKQFQVSSETRLVDDYTRSLNKLVEAEHNKLQLVGLSLHEQELLNIQNKADLDLNQKIEAETIKLGSVTAATRDLMKAKSKEATDAIIKDANARYEAERTWATGAKAALDSYVDAATNAAAQSNKLFTNAFKGMEDALVTFATTGKLSFTSLANSIMADMARLQIQQNITGPLAKSLGTANPLEYLFGKIGNAVGGTQAPAPVSDALIKTLPTFAIGTDYVPYDMVAQIHQGERIVPAAQNNGGPSANPVTVINHFSFSSPTDPRTQQQIAANAGLGVRRALARNT